MQFNNTKSIYLQIADYMYDRILGGDWPDGERVPSIRDLAVHMEVNPNTVTRTYTMLQDEGTLQNKRGIGYFTSEGARSLVLDKKRKDFIGQDLPLVFDTMDRLGISCDDLFKLHQLFTKERSE